MSTVQARDLAVGQTVDRLDVTGNGRPAFVTARVVKVETSIVSSSGDGEADRIVTWHDGRTVSYAASHRFVLPVEKGAAS